MGTTPEILDWICKNKHELPKLGSNARRKLDNLSIDRHVTELVQLIQGNKRP